MEEDFKFKNKQCILATDLDGTLIGDETAVKQFNDEISKLRSNVLLIYITGRTLKSTCELIKEKSLITPDIYIVSIGTEIYFNYKCIYDEYWDERISLNWDKDKLFNTISEDKSITNLKLECKKSKYGITYHCNNETSFNNSIIKIKRLIRSKHLNAKVISSMGHIINIVPQLGGKGNALEYIRDKYNIQRKEVFVCGDSGNDISMFLKGYNGIVVGNAQDELGNVLVNTEEDIYFSDKKYAYGILDGLKNYNLI